MGRRLLALGPFVDDGPFDPEIACDLFTDNQRSLLASFIAALCCRAAVIWLRDCNQSYLIHPAAWIRS
jgi:hypothetical protein